jgi:hypothetical protein
MSCRFFIDENDCEKCGDSDEEREGCDSDEKEQTEEDQTSGDDSDWSRKRVLTARMLSWKIIFSFSGRENCKRQMKNVMQEMPGLKIACKCTG